MQFQIKIFNQTERVLTMRKITSQSVDAFVNGYGFNQGNTSVSSCGYDEIKAWFFMLHNNRIAEKAVHLNELTIWDAGWQTVTTKERLNGILSRLTFGWSLFQKKGQWFLTNGDVTHEWSGAATFRAGHLIIC